MSSPVLSATNDLERVQTHFATVMGSIEPGLDPLSATRSMIDDYGALEPRPQLDELKREELVEGAVRGEWIWTPGAKSVGRIVFVHGGGFNSGSAYASRNISISLARLTGAPVLGLDYALAPEHRFPAGLNDVIDGIRWARTNGPEGATSTEPIVVVGESAGASLVVLAIADAVASGRTDADGIVLLSGYLELTDQEERFAPGDYIVPREATLAARADYLPSGISPEDPSVSPLRAPASTFEGFPPTLLQVSSTESMLSDARRFIELLAEAGVRSHLSVYPGGLPHVWHHFTAALPSATDALEEAATFIVTTTAAAQPVA
jgi:epsilon-lactone hydrolase